MAHRMGFIRSVAAPEGPLAARGAPGSRSQHSGQQQHQPYRQESHNIRGRSARQLCAQYPRQRQRRRQSDREAQSQRPPALTRRASVSWRLTSRSSEVPVPSRGPIASAACLNAQNLGELATYFAEFRTSTSAFSRMASAGLVTTLSPGERPPVTSMSPPKSWPS